MANRTFVYLKTAAPTASDDTAAGYKVGDGWYDTTNDKMYKAIDVSAGAAIWQQISGTGTVLTTPQINDTSSDHQYIIAVSELAADRTITLPLLTGNDTFVFADFTQTLTNKKITRRNVTVTQSATPEWNCDNGDIFTIDALAQAITSMSSGQTGTPVDRQEIDFEITDNSTARAITWGANFLGSSGTALPSTTVLGKTLYVKFRYNGSVWVCLASTSAL